MLPLARMQQSSDFSLCVVCLGADISEIALFGWEREAADDNELLMRACGPLTTSASLLMALDDTSADQSNPSSGSNQAAAGRSHDDDDVVHTQSYYREVSFGCCMARVQSIFNLWCCFDWLTRTARRMLWCSRTQQGRHRQHPSHCVSRTHTYDYS